MTRDDIEPARVVQALAMAGPDDPTDPSTFPPEATARQHRRYGQFLEHDAPGSWVAEDTDGVVVGSAIVEALGQGGLGAAERLVRELAAAVRAP